MGGEWEKGDENSKVFSSTQSAELVTFNQGGWDYGASLGKIKNSILNICHIVGNHCVHCTAEC